jgi:hypothetical protein
MGNPVCLNGLREGVRSGCSRLGISIGSLLLLVRVLVWRIIGACWRMVSSGPGWKR